MAKVLVTGAGGYIGSVATYLLLQQGHEVVAVDNFSTGYKQPLDVLQEKFGKEKLQYRELDLQNDISSLFKDHKFDIVIHYAASCLVDESMKEPDKYFENNIWGTLNLIKRMLENNVSKLIFSSTAAVYGDAQYVPIDENHPLKPINVYGESKLMAENIIKWLGKLKSLKYVSLRYFNVCGASDDGLIGDSKKPSMHLMQNAVRGALGIESFKLTYPEVDTPDKSPIRDYVNVVDLNEAHLKALDYLIKGGKSEIINLGSENGSSVIEIINDVKKVTGVSFEIGRGAPRKGDPARLIASNEKAKKILNWQPKRTLADSVKSFLLWYKDHPNGWE